MNGTFLRKEVYILFNLTSIVCYPKPKNLVISQNILMLPSLGICESKLDTSVLDTEISIDNYKIMGCDRNREGGGVVCL